ncbi:MAG TPA: hypothetical protein GYA07_10620 [Verrucomicrobia bacterium]|nr:hypothetical protein [Verrucomicrobiota bacterium]HOP98870.1 hypothetical protein [Verrucomicrobiota bacterium]HPU56130.1 hypothetical protein [Verrucomicrobiota bacterium]
MSSIQATTSRGAKSGPTWAERLSSRRAAFWAAALLVLSMGLLCEESVRRAARLEPAAIGIQPGRWLVQLSSVEGAAHFLYMWDVPAWTADGVYTGERVPVGGRHARGLKLAGFGFDLQLESGWGRRSPRPRVRIAIPYWFVSVLSGAWLFAQWCWHLGSRPDSDPRAVRGLLAYRGAFPWFLTCSLWFGAAALLWHYAAPAEGSNGFRALLTYPLFPLAGVFDPEHQLRDQRALPLYAFAFWALLFVAGLAFSRRRTTPALPGFILLLIGCGFSVAAVLVA